MRFWRTLSLLFAAGCAGGLAKALVAVTFTRLGINAALGSKMARTLSPMLVYDHVVWGGLWAFLFLIPVRRLNYFARGVLFSLGQTAVQLFLIAPQMGQGLLALKAGYATPFLVLFFGAVWGLAAGFWLTLVKER